MLQCVRHLCAFSITWEEHVTLYYCHLCVIIFILASYNHASQLGTEIINILCVQLICTWICVCVCVCVCVCTLKCKCQIQSHIRKTNLKILFQPFILFNHQFQTILQEVIHFSWYGNKVCWSQVETVPQPLWAAWHAETGFVVTEVAGMQINKRNTWYRHSSG